MLHPSTAAGPARVPDPWRLPAKFLALTTPAGLLHLYDEVGVPAAERRLPGPDGLTPEVEIPKWVEAAPRFGMSVVGPPIPE